MENAIYEIEREKMVNENKWFCVLVCVLQMYMRHYYKLRGKASPSKYWNIVHCRPFVALIHALCIICQHFVIYLLYAMQSNIIILFCLLKKVCTPSAYTEPIFKTNFKTKCFVWSVHFFSSSFHKPKHPSRTCYLLYCVPINWNFNILCKWSLQFLSLSLSYFFLLWNMYFKIMDSSIQTPCSTHLLHCIWQLL